MSRIQKPSKEIIEAIKPYLVTDEKIEKALVQDDKKQSLGLEIWLVKTNQAIILYGKQTSKEARVLVYPLDDISEIDYFDKKPDDINVMFFPREGIKSEKAKLHFSGKDRNDVEQFFLELGDIITYRTLGKDNKINVLCRALPIGDKNRKKYGRGREIKPVEPAKKDVAPAKDGVAPKKVGSEGVEKVKTVATKTVETSKVVDTPKNTIPSDSENKVEQKTVSSAVPNKEKEILEKVQQSASKSETQPTSKQISQTIQNNDAKKEQTEKVNDSKEDKLSISKDFGNPVYFIATTIIATIIGFFCLFFFRKFSRLSSIIAGIKKRL